jgi:hypothetical protein
MLGSRDASAKNRRFRSRVLHLKLTGLHLLQFSGHLAAYLEAADKFDWRAMNRPLAIGQLASVANGGMSGRHRSELAGRTSAAAS